MKFPSFHGSSIRMNGSSDRIYSVSVEIDRNLPQPTTVYGRRFIASDSYHFPTGFLLDTASFLPNTARFLTVFTGNAWKYCCQETLTWVYFFWIYVIMDHSSLLLFVIEDWQYNLPTLLKYSFPMVNYVLISIQVNWPEKGFKISLRLTTYNSLTYHERKSTVKKNKI